MSMQTLYRLRCDTKGCHYTWDVYSITQEEARSRARESGWDVGPRRRQVRSGTLIEHTDYCPNHKER